MVGLGGSRGRREGYATTVTEGGAGVSGAGGHLHYRQRKWHISGGRVPEAGSAALLSGAYRLLVYGLPGPRGIGSGVGGPGPPLNSVGGDGRFLDARPETVARAQQQLPVMILL